MAAICSAAWCVLHVSGYAPRHSQQLVFYLRCCKLPDIRIFSVSEKRIFTTACGCDFPLLNSAVHVQYNLWSNLMALFYNAIGILSNFKKLHFMEKILPWRLHTVLFHFLQAWCILTNIFTCPFCVHRCPALLFVWLNHGTKPYVLCR